MIDENGNKVSIDPILGKPIVGNLKRPYAKITYLDTDCQDKSAFYGMSFGISLDDSSENLGFYGKWTPSVIAQNVWPCIQCYTGGELYQDQTCFLYEQVQLLL